MSFLLVGDLHLTDRRQDAYRFGIFDWIREQQQKFEPEATFIMGDITDSKDGHSAALVNQIVEGLVSIAPDLFIIKGNHDFVDPTNPYFNFLNNIDGVLFVTNTVELTSLKTTIVPFIRDEVDFSKVVGSLEDCDFLFLHNTFAGAISETGQPLTGFSPKPLKRLKPRLGIYAGDVHKPQKAGPVTYVGAPYNIKFGDDFVPRCILLEKDGKQRNLYPNFLRKWKLTIRDPQELIKNKKLLEGDQVKIVLELAREESVEWKVHKQRVLDTCKELKLEVYGMELRVNSVTPQRKNSPQRQQRPEEAIEAFCKTENVPKAVKEAGLALLKE